MTGESILNANRREITKFGEGTSMGNRVRVVGIHRISTTQEPVHLVEIEIDGSPDGFDCGEITQETPGQPRSNRQAVYD